MQTDIISNFLSVKNISYVVLRISIFILTLIPGLFVHSFVLLPWYLFGAILFANRKYFEILELYVIFAFINLGLYQYGLLGPDRTFPVYNIFDKYLLVLLMMGAFLTKQKLTFGRKKILKFCVPFIVIAFLSGMVNLVDPIDLVNYFTSTFRWFILLYVILKLDITLEKFQKLMLLLIVIIMVNSILGGMQSLFLPIQTTPDGYTPNYLDVASGLLGATASQFLTVLCLSFVTLFTLAYLAEKKKSYLVYITLLLVQPFLSSSKAALVLMGSTFGIFTISYLIFHLKNAFSFSTVVLISLFFVASLIGINYFEQINSSYFGKVSSNVQSFFDTKRDIEDFQKVMGYVEAYTIVAPTGNLGVFFGVGPTNYFSFVGLKKNNKWLKNLGIDQETLNKSSADFKGTDITGLIGELGFLGLATFIFMIYKFFSYFSQQMRRDPNTFLLYYFGMFYLVVLILFSLYSYGWFFPFMYLPFIVLIGLASKLQANE